MKTKKTEQRTLYGRFTDAVIYSKDTKTAVSVRDGVLEYMGAELGIQPSDKIFTVYRSPATIANTASKMQNIPLTDEHVEVGGTVKNSTGSVTHAVMIDQVDSETFSTLAIQNTIKVSDSALSILENGKRELSLGYEAELIESDIPEYDFIQQNIEPHHLAIVDRGRCGSKCAFIDNKPLTKQEPQMAKKKIVAAIQAVFTDKKVANRILDSFKDEDGSLRLDEMVEFVNELSKTAKSLTVKQIQTLKTSLEEVKEDLDEAIEEGGESSSETSSTDADDTKSTDLEDKEKEKIPVKDTAEFKDAVQKATDKAVKDGVAKHTEVMQRASEFLPDNYDFKDKSTPKIMRDCLATQYGTQKFEDTELGTAFKMMRPVAALTLKLADDDKNNFNSVADQEI